MADAIIGAAGKTGEIKSDYLPARAVDVNRRCASTNKMRELLKVSCDISLEDGIKYTVAEDDIGEVVAGQRLKLVAQEL